MAGTSTKTLTPSQLNLYRQQMLMRQQHQQLKALHAQALGQKVSLAVAAGVQQRATLMKQSGVNVGKQVTRPVTEAEMATLLKHQAASQRHQQKTVTQVQVPGQVTLTPAQLFAQAGLQQAGPSTGTPVATLVKAANVTGVRTATPQQLRQLQLHPQLLTQRKLPGQKVAQLAQVAGKSGIQTQLIVQQKSVPAAMTVQQIQQVINRGVPQGFTHVSAGQGVNQPGQMVLAKSPIQARVIPVSVAGGIKQTIQVVTASSAQLRQTPPQGKPIVTTARVSPGPSQQVRLQTVQQAIHQHGQAHAQGQGQAHAQGQGQGLNQGQAQNPDNLGK